jgi:hypothetical protein
MDSLKNIRKMKPGTIALDVTQNTLTCDPVSGHYLLMTQDSLYEYDIIADAWSAVCPNLLKTAFSPEKGVVGVQIAAYGVMAFLDRNMSYPIVLYKLANPTGAEHGNAQAKGAAAVSVSPNPFRSSVNIRLPEGATTCSIHDLNGRLLKRFVPGAAGGLTWNAGNAPAGLYLLHAEISGKTHTLRLLLQK